MAKDFESRFFDLLMDRLDKQDRKLEEIHDQVKYTNGRVTALEKDTVPSLDKAIKKLEGRQGKRFTMEPRTQYLLAISAVIIVLIVATLLRVPIKGILP